MEFNRDANTASKKYTAANMETPVLSHIFVYRVLGHHPVTIIRSHD